jgi:hypothetical protein
MLELLFTCGGVLLFAYVLRKLREYSRRHIFGRKRARQIQAAFPEFCYQPFPTSRDISDLACFPYLAATFELSINQRLLGGRPEMYNMINDQRGNLHRSAFDLRSVSKSFTRGAAYSETHSVFLISLSDQVLTPFQINRYLFGYGALRGDPPKIDIDNKLVLPKSLSLTGLDQEAVTKLFDITLVRFFRSHSLLFTFGALDVKQDAIIFLHTRACSPKDIRSTLDALLKLTEILAR